MVKCPVCLQTTEISSNDKNQWYNLFKNNHFLMRLTDAIYKKREHSLFLCNNCDLIFIEPMKNPGSQFYENSLYYRAGKILDIQQLGWQQNMFLNDKIPSSGNLLDIGCGAGLFIKNAQEIGYKVTGIDFDPTSIDIAKKKYGLKDVYSETIEKFIETITDKFDIITMFEVLEHLDNPREVFQQIKKMLKPGGYIAISTPNRERGIDTFTDMDMPPNHLTHWNYKSLNYLLSEFGFKIVKSERTIKSNDIAVWLSIKTSIGLVKKKVKLSKIKPISNQSVNLLKLLSKCKSKLVSVIGSILYLPFAIMKKQSSTIYILAQRIKQ